MLTTAAKLVVHRARAMLTRATDAERNTQALGGVFELFCELKRCTSKNSRMDHCTVAPCRSRATAPRGAVRGCVVDLVARGNLADVGARAAPDGHASRAPILQFEGAGSDRLVVHRFCGTGAGVDVLGHDRGGSASKRERRERLLQLRHGRGSALADATRAKVWRAADGSPSALHAVKTTSADGIGVRRER